MKEINTWRKKIIERRRQRSWKGKGGSQWYFCGSAKLRPWPQSKRRSAVIFGQFPSKRQAILLCKQKGGHRRVIFRKRNEMKGDGENHWSTLCRPFNRESVPVAIASIISLRFSTTVQIPLVNAILVSPRVTSSSSDFSKIPNTSTPHVRLRGIFIHSNHVR